jgi:hypothetical protein
MVVNHGTTTSTIMKRVVLYASSLILIVWAVRGVRRKAKRYRFASRLFYPHGYMHEVVEALRRESEALGESTTPDAAASAE